MQQLNPSEISDIIKQRISQLDVASQATNEGTIVSVTDGIIRIHGLTEVQYGEMIEFEGNVFGLDWPLTLSVTLSVLLYWVTTSSWPRAKLAAVLVESLRFQWAQSSRGGLLTPWVTQSMARALSRQP